QRKLRRLAREWIWERRGPSGVAGYRFDVVGVSFGPDGLADVDHIRAAFLDLIDGLVGQIELRVGDAREGAAVERADAVADDRLAVLRGRVADVSLEIPV